MGQQHLITPPPPQDKFKRWEDDILNERENVDIVLDCAWKDGYRAGADAELEACCALIGSAHVRDMVRAARRPKPPSLAEQGLETLKRISKDCYPCIYQDDADWDTIRAALKRLQELENNG